MEQVDVDYLTGLAMVTQPSGEGDVSRLLVNEPVAIPSLSQLGMGSGYWAWPARVAYQSDNNDAGDPQPGESWGPRAGSWFLHRGHPGFRIIGGAAFGVVNVMPDPVRQKRRVVLDGTLQPCGSALATVMHFDQVTGTYCNPGSQITVYDSISLVQTELDPGVWLWATWMSDAKRWEVVAVGDFGCCSGSGSGSGMQECVSMLGGADLTKLESLDPDGEQPVALYLQGGCLKTGPTVNCESGSGSGS